MDHVNFAQNIDNTFLSHCIQKRPILRASKCESEPTVTLHPQASAYIEWTIKEHVPPLSTLSPTQARTWDAKITTLLSIFAPLKLRIHEKLVFVGRKHLLPIMMQSGESI